MFNFLTTVRVVIKAVRSGKIQLVDLKGNGEQFTQKELFQQYGFASQPLPEAEGILLFLNSRDNGVVVATEDRRYRPALASGESVMFTDEGDYIHFKRGRIIEVYAGEKLKVTTKEADVNASVKATIKSPLVNVVASTKVTLTTPLVEASQDVSIGGDLSVGGKADVVGNVSSTAQIADVTGTIASMRAKYNSHTHPENGTGGGTTSQPTQQM